MTTETYTTTEVREVEVEVEVLDDSKYDVEEDGVYYTVTEEETVIEVDTLVSGTNIDLSVIANNPDLVHTIEDINIDNAMSQSIKLTIDDVLTITDNDNILRINGDENDTLHLNTQGVDAEWVLGDFKTDAESGHVYQEVASVGVDETVFLEVHTDIEIAQS